MSDTERPNIPAPEIIQRLDAAAEIAGKIEQARTYLEAIATLRDRLRTVTSELEEVSDAIDLGQEHFARALRSLEEGLDDISQYI